MQLSSDAYVWTVTTTIMWPSSAKLATLHVRYALQGYLTPAQYAHLFTICLSNVQPATIAAPTITLIIKSTLHVKLVLNIAKDAWMVLTVLLVKLVNYYTNLNVMQSAREGPTPIVMELSAWTVLQGASRAQAIVDVFHASVNITSTLHLDFVLAAIACVKIVPVLAKLIVLLVLHRWY